MKKKVSIFSGRACKVLANKIADIYGIPLGEVIVSTFSDGEFQVSYEENIRGREVFIIQTTTTPAENIWELLMLIDAAKRASAKSIVAVIPYFGFARQDRKDKPRVSIAAKLMANLLTHAGVNRIVTIDLHADQIQGFFDVPVDHLYASSIFVPYLKKLEHMNIMMASPDTGGTRRAGAYAKFLHTDLATCYKMRPKPNQISNMQLVGNVKDRDVIIVDDMIDTGGTMIKASKLMMDKGARSVRAMCTHPVLSGGAFEKLKNSPIQQVITTDTIPLKEEEAKSDYFTVLSTASLFAEVIKRVHKEKSISSLFKIN